MDVPEEPVLSQETMQQESSLTPNIPLHPHLTVDRNTGVYSKETAVMGTMLLIAPFTPRTPEPQHLLSKLTDQLMPKAKQNRTD